MTKQYGFIEDIIVKPGYESMQLDYGIGKALLNFIDRREMADVYAAVSSDNVNFKQTLKRLRFIKSGNKDMPQFAKEYDEVFYLSLENYFTLHCGVE